MRQYADDRAYADTCNGEIIDNLAEIFGTTKEEWRVDEYLDDHEAADFVCDRLGITIAARVRNYIKYFYRYGHQFTIRSRRDSGATTELSKILSGFGNYLFYGFQDRGQIYTWQLVSLEYFRDNYKATPHIPNGDGTYFQAFNITDYQEGIIAKV